MTKRPGIPERVLLGVALAAALLFFVGLAVDSHALRMAAKPWPVLAMAFWVRGAARDRYGRFILAGLVACLAGDMLLEASPSLFIAGLVAFLVGHLLYIGAYLTRSRALCLARLVAPAIYGLGALAIVWDGLGDMAVPVVIYTSVICAMVWRAWAMSDGVVPRGAVRLAVIGASVFAVSDGLIAVSRFHLDIPGVRYAILTLYWLGQLGIARSVVSET